MSNKRKSYFLLIRVIVEAKVPIVIPIPLAILEATIDSAIDLLLLILSIRKVIGGRDKILGSIGEFTELISNIISELRKNGRYRFVEVETKKEKVYIDFY